MQAAFVASVGRPAWWTMALAAFLVRGGIVLVLLPLVSLPSVPSLATAFAPSIEALALSRHSVEAALIGTALIGAVVLAVAAAGFVGSWLDLALAREAQDAGDLDLREPWVAPSAWRSFAIRFTSHLPTFLALAYAVVRLVIATYNELLSPGDPAIPIALRVLARAPETAVVVVVAWLFGEALGGIAARRAAEGETATHALRGALRDLAARRGVATFVVTDLTVLAVLFLDVTVVGRAVEHARVYLLLATDAVSIAAALLLLAATWVLGLAVLGAALAWRATAWTIETAPRRQPAEAAARATESVTPEEAPAG
jgi:hypothetical protein